MHKNQWQRMWHKASAFEPIELEQGKCGGEDKHTNNDLFELKSRQH